MSIRVELAEQRDRQGCLELIAALTGATPDASWREAYDELVQGRRGAILLAREGQEILGVVTLSYNVAVRYGGEYCQLEELIVDDRARGKQVGRLLMERAIECAREQGCAEIGLYLLESTEGNRSFYEKFGFEYTGSELRQRLR
jgi:GNAT superfamily N-acetyltransferase